MHSPTSAPRANSSSWGSLVFGLVSELQDGGGTLPLFIVALAGHGGAAFMGLVAVQVGMASDEPVRTGFGTLRRRGPAVPAVG
jgi:hypothetical protein